VTLEQTEVVKIGYARLFIKDFITQISNSHTPLCGVFRQLSTNIDNSKPLCAY